eukprot:4635468-Prymnesium_polylepis.1
MKLVAVTAVARSGASRVRALSMVEEAPSVSCTMTTKEPAEMETWTAEALRAAAVAMVVRSPSSIAATTAKCSCSRAASMATSRTRVISAACRPPGGSSGGGEGGEG